MKQNFHNTIEAAGSYEKELNKKAKTSEQIILNWFHQNPMALVTPFMVEKTMKEMGHEWPITSVRRAITNLTKSGFLIKSHVMLEGNHGLPNHAWKLNIAKAEKTYHAQKQVNKRKAKQSGLQLLGGNNLFNLNFTQS